MNAAVIDRSQVQRLVLTGCDADCSLHLVLTVTDAGAARRFLGQLAERRWITHAAAGRNECHPLADAGGPGAVLGVGFTFRGLAELQLPQRYLDELRAKAKAFTEGAPRRAAQFLADTGPSAAEGWETPFGIDVAHVLILIHADDEQTIERAVDRLQSLDGAAGLSGWRQQRLPARHLTTDRKDDRGRKIRHAHFGLRDGIAQPVVVASPGRVLHRAGELLLGHVNDDGFNRWSGAEATRTTEAFFSDGSFAALRKIEQHEGEFRAYLDRCVAQLKAEGIVVTADYLKAKLCGRWPNGAVVQPGIDVEPAAPASDAIDAFDFSDDAHGHGCPFGSHVRRTNPRSDPIAPRRQRPLFRRGMPYGPLFDDDAQAMERGLLGLFFCASLEDQFEHLLSQWVDRKPMGPDNRGDAKDPLIGQHDDAQTVFEIPQQNASRIELKGFTPFATTRGTLYAFFPSLAAIGEIAALQVAPAAARAARPLPKPLEDTAPKDRYCDVVMEGGVTSGVIYPPAVVELAKHYRFQSIGGTSIGAFAAAVTAAAEYRRRKGSMAGFEEFGRLPERLAEEIDGKTRLLWMFRAEPKAQRLFEIFLAALNRKSSWSRIGAGFCAALRQYRRAVFAGVALSVALIAIGPLALAWQHWQATGASGFALALAGLGSLAYALLLACAFTVLASLGFAVWRDVMRGLVPNGFGMCNGGPVEDEPLLTPTLSRALHQQVQLAAGRHPIDDPPLTFDDLWTAPGYPPKRMQGAGDAGPSIRLEVYATNLTHSRPYRFPLDQADDMGRLFFKEAELAPYFPKAIIRHLVAYSKPYAPASASDPAAGEDTRDLLELPRGKLPIAVAARLSLGFPLLISAVPLWAIDYEPRRSDRRLARCWFADGGLCSNFPIHLFDSFVPEWPTFGISLGIRSKYRPKQPTWLPQKHTEGRGDTWDRFDDLPSASDRLGGFLLSLWKASWRWNDATTMRMPGVRDRVVRVLLEPDEGGINIKMRGKEIAALARTYGKRAADEFRARFIDGDGFAEHRWVRFTSLLVAMRDRIKNLAAAAELDRHALPLSTQIARAQWNAPLAGADERPLTAEQVSELQQLLAALKQLEDAFITAGDHKPYRAVPRPTLRIRHPT